MVCLRIWSLWEMWIVRRCGQDGLMVLEDEALRQLLWVDMRQTGRRQRHHGRRYGVVLVVDGGDVVDQGFLCAAQLLERL